jgi:NAD(P)-dependent dehydrogenase (short-subunit alcohol dehydrogenase family)
MTIVVTGGARGIGRACVLGAADRGWPVVFSWVADADAAARTAADAGAAGGRALAVRADAASEADTIALFDAAEAFGGPVRGVVVNAGVVAGAAPLAAMTADRLRRMVEINLLGALLTAREAARRLARGRGGPGGAVVLMSSAAARLGAPGLFVDYAATKGALDTLALGLARELGPEGVRVNAVRPGIIDTDIHAAAGEPDRAARLGPTAPLGRAGAAEEVAAAALWLLSDEASYVTGAIVDVTGGR